MRFLAKLLILWLALVGIPLQSLAAVVRPACHDQHPRVTAGSAETGKTAVGSLQFKVQAPYTGQSHLKKYFHCTGHVMGVCALCCMGSAPPFPSSLTVPAAPFAVAPWDAPAARVDSFIPPGIERPPKLF